MVDSTKLTSVTIPLLPAVSMDESLAVWDVLGFSVTLRQKAPNAYAVIRADDIELHLFGLQIEPERNFTTCLVIVADVEGLHASYRARLQQHLGRLPYRGLPRLSRMRPGQTRFTLTDVAGNSVIFVKRGPGDDEAAGDYKRAGQTPLQRAVALAERERDFKNDDAAAARQLDRTIERFAGDLSADYQRALEARIELADLYDEDERAQELRETLGALKN